MRWSCRISGWPWHQRQDTTWSSKNKSSSSSTRSSRTRSTPFNWGWLCLKLSLARTASCQSHHPRILSAVNLKFRDHIVSDKNPNLFIKADLNSPKNWKLRQLWKLQLSWKPQNVWLKRKRKNWDLPKKLTVKLWLYNRRWKWKQKNLKFSTSWHLKVIKHPSLQSSLEWVSLWQLLFPKLPQNRNLAIVEHASPSPVRQLPFHHEVVWAANW